MISTIGLCLKLCCSVVVVLYPLYISQLLVCYNREGQKNKIVLSFQYGTYVGLKGHLKTIATFLYS